MRDLVSASSTHSGPTCFDVGPRLPPPLLPSSSFSARFARALRSKGPKGRFGLKFFAPSTRHSSAACCVSCDHLRVRGSASVSARSRRFWRGDGNAFFYAAFCYFRERGFCYFLNFGRSNGRKFLRAKGVRSKREETASTKKLAKKNMATFPRPRRCFLC